jgi:hypothetical protein
MSNLGVLALHASTIEGQRRELKNGHRGLETTCGPRSAHEATTADMLNMLVRLICEKDSA